MVVYGEGAYTCLRHGPVRAPARDPAALARGRFEPGCPRCGAPLQPAPVREDAPLEPRSLYAATKLHQEHLVGVYARERPGARAVALRYHNVYGPRMPRDTPYAGVASIFRSALAAGRPPRVFEDGRQLRDFVHVRDVARANVLALTASEPLPSAINVASGALTPLFVMAEALADATGPDAPRPEITGEYRLGDVRHVFASARLAREALGFRARIGLREGLRELASASLRAPA
jgi:dTDP-L-rhamnose 4-epimerase